MTPLPSDRPRDEAAALSGRPATVDPARSSAGDPSSGTTGPRLEGLTEVDDLAELTGLAEGTALAGVAVPPLRAEAVAGRRSRRWAPPSAVRRPPAYLAAALAGAVALGLLSSGTGAAADTRTDAGTSVSVAAELGLDERSATTVEPEATARLGEMTASRTAREDAQAAAAQVQADADRLAAEAAAEAARPQAVLPVDGARLTSGFGARWGRTHAGIDLAAPMLTPEKAAADGVVLEAGPASGYGNVVYIQHDNGDVTVYGHMEEILVSAGQVVRAGDTIALLGNRGQSTGPHLHFEVIIGGLTGQKVDPLPWLRERGVQI
jgi:murein DD-endopeptidase MepM/ murein hydrolase activator NlpD